MFPIVVGGCRVRFFHRGFFVSRLCAIKNHYRRQRNCIQRLIASECSGVPTGSLNMLAGKILFLLCVANGAPIILDKLLGNRYAWPLDGGRAFLDGQPLFGPSKTWRGVIGALILTALAAEGVGFSLALGMMIAGAAMLGDICSSFVKRRLGIPPSGMALGLDQIPESLLPLYLLRREWGLTAWEILMLVAAFWISELMLSRILYHLDIRKQPY
jgi:CDP-2,3-bis-(O-geranylgeranyl)-sn-glycerol synthase